MGDGTVIDSDCGPSCSLGSSFLWSCGCVGEVAGGLPVGYDPFDVALGFEAGDGAGGAALGCHDGCGEVLHAQAPVSSVGEHGQGLVAAEGEKINARDRVHAVIIAYDVGLVPLTEQATGT